MKLQHIAILFVLIIVPISLVMASYIQNQIDAITLQTAYDSSLISATYDAMKAFQLNTTNNMYSSISDSKMRDIEASVNTFYNSLNTSMQEYAQKAKDLEVYVPAVIFTLYDGYYIHTSFDNVYSKSGDGENEKVSIDIDVNNKTNGLKPYIYYSAKYKLQNGNIIVVNYSLDNLITVYGDFGDGYQTRSGYLINLEGLSVNNTNKTVTYDGLEIGKETLREHLRYFIESNDGRDILENGDFYYIFYNNEKVYLDETESGRPLYIEEDGSFTETPTATTHPAYFWYHDYRKTYVQSESIIEKLNTYNMQSDSAYRYYSEAKEFTEWVNDKLGNITQKDLIRFEDGINTIDNDNEYLSENTGNEYIFRTSEDNDPLVSDSVFNNHRLAVIRKSMESTLSSAIKDYSSTALYDYALPVISDEDWYSILNNVSMVTFLQGLSIGYRIYNNYTVITNNVNKEAISSRNIYIIVENKTTKEREYHQPGCKELLEGVEDGSLEIKGAYPIASFQRQSVRVGEDSSQDQHYYLQAVDDKPVTGCYNCIVKATPDYDVDDIISGNDLIDFENREENQGSGEISFKKDNSAYKQIRQIYLRALARERYDIYKTNFDLDINR